MPLDPETRAWLTDRAGQPLEDLAEKYSSAQLERVVTDDGRGFVLKHLSSEGDWLTRATGGAGRAFALWSSGVFDDVGGAVDHTMIDCLQTREGWTVVMRDASDDLIPPRVPVDGDTVRQVLRGLGKLHACEAEVPDGLCSIADRYQLFSPQFHVRDTGPGPHPMQEAIVAGWEVFHDLVPDDVASAIDAVHADATPIERALSGFSRLLLHGDAKLENMGLHGDTLVLVDWGDLTTAGPAEVDVAWFAVRGAARIGVDTDGIFSEYEAQTGGRLDATALDLACLGSLAQMGFRMANAAMHGRPEPKEFGRAQLDWWTGRVRRSLDSLPL